MDSDKFGQTLREPDVCPRCHHRMLIGEFPFCPHEAAVNAVIGDDIPGGLEVKNGICWPDGTPRKFYAKSEIRRVAYEQGWSVAGDTPKPNPRIVEREHIAREKRRRG